MFDDDESDFDNEYDDDKCCVCNLFSPPGLKECNDVVIVKWAECTKCGHWCHLRFCSAVKVVRRLGEFFAHIAANYLPRNQKKKKLKMSANQTVCCLNIIDS